MPVVGMEEDWIRLGAVRLGDRRGTTEVWELSCRSWRSADSTSHPFTGWTALVTMSRCFRSLLSNPAYKITSHDGKIFMKRQELGRLEGERGRCIAATTWKRDIRPPKDAMKLETCTCLFHLGSKTCGPGKTPLDASFDFRFHIFSPAPTISLLLSSTHSTRRDSYFCRARGTFRL